MMRSVALVLIVLLQLVLPCPVNAQQPTLSEFLPTAASIGNGVVVTDEGARSLEDIAGTFADPADAQARLSGWGWHEQSFRYFEATEPDVPLTTLEVSLHRFSSFQNATAALPYFLDARAEALGIQEIPVALERAQARGIAGEVAQGREATVYAIKDAILVRVTAISATGDPQLYAEAAAQFVVDQSNESSVASDDGIPATNEERKARGQASASLAQAASTSAADCEKAIRKAIVGLGNAGPKVMSLYIRVWPYADEDVLSYLGIPLDCTLPEHAPVLITDGPVHGLCLWWNPETSALTGGPIARSSAGVPITIGSHWECYSIYSGWFNRFYPGP